MSIQFQRLIVPVNGTAGDARAIDLVGRLVQKQMASVTLIYVVEVAQSMPLDAELPAEIEKGEIILGNAEQAARRILVHKGETVLTELLQARSAGSAIVDEAIERNADAIVMAACNHHHHGKTTLGETVGYVLKNAPCEVIVLRQVAAGERQW
jgi:nucleotide-binding universal stress UspA family protein